MQFVTLFLAMLVGLIVFLIHVTKEPSITKPAFPLQIICIEEVVYFNSPPITHVLYKPDGTLYTCIGHPNGVITRGHLVK